MALASKFCFILLLASGALIAQQREYRVHDLKDSAVHTLRIEDASERDFAIFFINNCAVRVERVRGIKAVTLFQNRFLAVQFVIRGGSGVKLRRTILFCVSNGKIHKALDILSQVTSRLDRAYDRVADSLKLFDEKEDYVVSMEISKSKDSYRLRVQENLKVQSKFDPTQNEKTDRVCELQFDGIESYFFNSSRKLDGTFQVYQDGSPNPVERSFRGDFPVVQLYRYQYILVEKTWYFENSKNTLSSF